MVADELKPLAEMLGPPTSVDPDGTIHWSSGATQRPGETLDLTERLKAAGIPVLPRPAGAPVACPAVPSLTPAELAARLQGMSPDAVSGYVKGMVRGTLGALGSGDLPSGAAETLRTLLYSGHGGY